jgi:excisionase family DNA binding protein
MEFFTVGEVATMLKLTERTVYKLAASGELESLKLGYRTLRFTPDGIRKFTESKVKKVA